MHKYIPGMTISEGGGAFLNHYFSLLYYYGLLNALRNTGLDEKYSAEDILKLTKNIYRITGFDIISVKCIAYIVNIWYDKHRLLI